ncbi:hypothetical protein CB0940_10645 [Cercospora beticola]|uniref:Uncharacterized protein n=1 Tax=Cercospora beticola TaxID=122368 RepID=A0A2G5HUT7_CERBT|nr:hypothetical protein CB0940_10645 [Cercospora beticola]PIA96053.1 hypothetical protein CB0940_10645 [Cercospora beticola]WPB07372.1 hypothetical protein RHO25_012033 [Cercospora beticola]
MAFQQPQQRPRPARQLSIDYTPQQRIPAPTSPATRRTIEDSQEWILFQPQSDQQSATGTSRTPRTATHRTLSDIASLETHIKSENNPDDSGTCLGTEADELDSLDDGLHAFHNPFAGPSNLDHSGGTVLPTHDGFGTFPSGVDLQEHLWQFERYNPHRRSSKHVRRRSSVQRKLDELEVEQEISAEDDRTARIEKWRLDQSKAVLEEIERETRRRRRRLSRMTTATSAGEVHSQLQDEALSRVFSRQDSVMTDAAGSTKTEPAPQSESWWRRITRKVIQDLIGLDDATLSVIFGEQLADDASPTPRDSSPLATRARKESRVSFHDSDPAWEVKLLDRIARELGILVNTLAEADGSAFSTYKNAQEQEIEYAGLPRNIPRQPSLRQRRREEKARKGKAPIDNAFAPTVPQSPLTAVTEPADTSLWGIEEEPDELTDEEEHGKLQKEREYWERDVDVKMVFSYLKNRFSNAQPGPQPSAADSIGPLPASWATTGTVNTAMGTSPESERRKEIIRQQHPLVSKAAERALERAQLQAVHARRRESMLKKRHMEQLARKRTGDSSCASQSTKRSRHTKSGSSRHYWDIGGSAGSIHSGQALSSALGAWGEV